MQTSTEMTWILLLLVLLFAFVSGGSISENPLIWGSAMFLQIPITILTAVAAWFPLLAPILVILMVKGYFHGILTDTVGQGFLLFILVSVFAVMFSA